ncbi:hypothetical protein [Selenomonas montiformis]|nr:hypothetical protein [Selenomonas montiformis]
MKVCCPGYGSSVRDYENFGFEEGILREAMAYTAGTVIAHGLGKQLQIKFVYGKIICFCAKLVHEAEFVLLEDSVDLEGDLLHDFAVVGVVDDEEVLGIAAVVACLEVEGAAEGALSVLLADFIGDDLLDVADDIAVGIGEVDVEVRGDEAGAYGLELVEVQAEAHKENDLVSIKYLANSCFTVLVHDEFQMYLREVKV